eukprot:g1506.t1
MGSKECEQQQLYAFCTLFPTLEYSQEPTHAAQHLKRRRRRRQRGSKKAKVPADDVAALQQAEGQGQEKQQEFHPWVPREDEDKDADDAGRSGARGADTSRDGDSSGSGSGREEKATASGLSWWTSWSSTSRAKSRSRSRSRSDSSSADASMSMSTSSSTSSSPAKSPAGKPVGDSGGGRGGSRGNSSSSSSSSSGGSTSRSVVVTSQCFVLLSSLPFAELLLGVLDNHLRAYNANLVLVVLRFINGVHRQRRRMAAAFAKKQADEDNDEDNDDEGAADTDALVREWSEQHKRRCLKLVRRVRRLTLRICETLWGEIRIRVDEEGRVSGLRRPEPGGFCRISLRSVPQIPKLEVENGMRMLAGTETDDGSGGADAGLRGAEAKSVGEGKGQGDGGGGVFNRRLSLLAGVDGDDEESDDADDDDDDDDDDDNDGDGGDGDEDGQGEDDADSVSGDMADGLTDTGVDGEGKAAAGAAEEEEQRHEWKQTHNEKRRRKRWRWRQQRGTSEGRSGSRRALFSSSADATDAGAGAATGASEAGAGALKAAGAQQEGASKDEGKGQGKGKSASTGAGTEQGARSKHSKQTFVFQRPRGRDLTSRESVIRDEESALLRPWALPVLLSTLSLDSVLMLLGLLMTEMRVVMVSDEPSRLTACVLGMLLLLRPLRWKDCNVAICSVPEYIAGDLVDAPTPLVVGLARLPPNLADARPNCRGLVLVLLDQDRIRLHDDDKLSYGERKLPLCESLVCEMQPTLKRMLNLYNGGHGSPYSSGGGGGSGGSLYNSAGSLSLPPQTLVRSATTGRATSAEASAHTAKVLSIVSSGGDSGGGSSSIMGNSGSPSSFQTSAACMLEVDRLVQRIHPYVKKLCQSALAISASHLNRLHQQQQQQQQGQFLPEADLDASNADLVFWTGVVGRHGHPWGFMRVLRNTQVFSEYRNSEEGKATDKRLNDTQWCTWCNTSRFAGDGHFRLMMLCDVIVALPVPGCSWAINCIFIIESRPGLEHLLLHNDEAGFRTAALLRTLIAKRDQQPQYLFSTAYLVDASLKDTKAMFDVFYSYYKKGGGVIISDGQATARAEGRRVILYLKADCFNESRTTMTMLRSKAIVNALSATDLVDPTAANEVAGSQFGGRVYICFLSTSEFIARTKAPFTIPEFPQHLLRLVARPHTLFTTRPPAAVDTS